MTHYVGFSALSAPCYRGSELKKEIGALQSLVLDAKGEASLAERCAHLRDLVAQLEPEYSRPNHAFHDA